LHAQKDNLFQICSKYANIRLSYLLSELLVTVFISVHVNLIRWIKKAGRFTRGSWQVNLKVSQLVGVFLFLFWHALHHAGVEQCVLTRFGTNNIMQFHIHCSYKAHSFVSISYDLLNPNVHANSRFDF